MSDDINNLGEPEAAYSANSSKKTIRFFNSFDEAEEYGLREMANHSHEERLRNLQILRKRIYSEYLLPDGTWPRMERKLTIIKASYL